MRKTIIAALIMGAAQLACGPALAQHKTAEPAAQPAHGHARDDAARKIYEGYFSDAAVKARPLADWEGAWQSVYPYLLDGTLDPVMKSKAERGAKTAAEHHAYYAIGYKTDVDRVDILGDRVTFHRGDAAVSASYASDGMEILTYAKGNRGVRFIFRKTSGHADAPAFIQFSDHRIAPAQSDHFHLYSGADRAALLKEVTNWPTYYPFELSKGQIVEEMLAH